MPCGAAARGIRQSAPHTGVAFNDTTDNNPCGKPALISVGLVDVTAEALCYPHWMMKHGSVDAQRPYIYEGGTLLGWGPTEASGTLGLVNSLYNTSSGGAVTGVPPNNGEIVLMRVNAIGIGRYRVVPSQDVQQPGVMAVQGGAVYFYKTNFDGVDNTAALAALVATAVTVDWRAI